MSAGLSNFKGLNCHRTPRDLKLTEAATTAFWMGQITQRISCKTEKAPKDRILMLRQSSHILSCSHHGYYWSNAQIKLYFRQVAGATYSPNRQIWLLSIWNISVIRYPRDPTTWNTFVTFQDSPCLYLLFVSERVRDDGSLDMVKLNKRFYGLAIPILTV